MTEELKQELIASGDYVDMQTVGEQMFINDCLSAGIPSTCAGIRLSQVKARNEEQQKLINILNILLEKRTWCVTVLGAVGNGKTTLTTAFVAEHIRKYAGNGYRQHYETLDSLLDKIKRGFSPNNSRYEEYAEELRTCELLVIDELSPSAWTPFAKETVQNILKARHANNLSTVIVGNVTGADMRSMFEEMVLSRLRTGFITTMKSNDMRTKGDTK